jgi:hypothetical protein
LLNLFLSLEGGGIRHIMAHGMTTQELIPVEFADRVFSIAIALFLNFTTFSHPSKLLFTNLLYCFFKSLTLAQQGTGLIQRIYEFICVQYGGSFHPMTLLQHQLQDLNEFVQKWKREFGLSTPTRLRKVIAQLESLHRQKYKSEPLVQWEPKPGPAVFWADIDLFPTKNDSKRVANCRKLLDGAMETLGKICPTMLAWKREGAKKEENMKYLDEVSLLIEGIHVMGLVVNVEWRNTKANWNLFNEPWDWLMRIDKELRKNNWKKVFEYFRYLLAIEETKFYHFQHFPQYLNALP